ncbi:hypothetical protein D3C85_1673550 [compost metagenome]
MSISWLAEVALPDTTDRAVTATPTTGAWVATCGCMMLLKWYRPLWYGVMSCSEIGKVTAGQPVVDSIVATRSGATRRI